MLVVQFRVLWVRNRPAACWAIVLCGFLVTQSRNIGLHYINFLSLPDNRSLPADWRLLRTAELCAFVFVSHDGIAQYWKQPSLLFLWNWKAVVFFDILYSFHPQTAVLDWHGGNKSTLRQTSFACFVNSSCFCEGKSYFHDCNLKIIVICIVLSWLTFFVSLLASFYHYRECP